MCVHSSFSLCHILFLLIYGCFFLFKYWLKAHIWCFLLILFTGILGYPDVIPLTTSTPGTISWISFDVPLNEYYHFIGCIVIIGWARWPMKTILTWTRLSDRTAFLANCPRGWCRERNHPWVSEDGSLASWHKKRNIGYLLQRMIQKIGTTLQYLSPSINNRCHYITGNLNKRSNKYYMYHCWTEANKCYKPCFPAI